LRVRSPGRPDARHGGQPSADSNQVYAPFMGLFVYSKSRRARAHWIAAVAVGAVCSVLASPTVAGESEKAVARAHYETATRLYEIREYTDALKEYKAAYVAKPDPAFLFNIGQCYRKMDKNAEALNFFQQFLKKVPADDPNRAAVEARIRNIEAGLNSAYDPFDKSGDGPTQEVARQVQPSATLDPSSATKREGLPEPTLPAQPVPPLPATPSPFPAQPGTRFSSQPAGQPSRIDLTAPISANEAGSSPPIYRKWWFWTGIGAAVAVVTVTAIVLSSGGSTTNPSSTLGSRSVFQ
jgi:hypothetical protein